MQRVVVLGRGSVRQVGPLGPAGELTGLPVIELDKLCWRADLTPAPPDQWSAMQRGLARRKAWIADGDLGPYDVLDVRLRVADTVLLLDFALLRCSWRAAHRSAERADFWRWLVAYRRHWRPRILHGIRAHAPAAEVHVLRNPRSVDRFIEQVARRTSTS